MLLKMILMMMMTFGNDEAERYDGKASLDDADDDKKSEERVLLLTLTR